MTESYSKLLSDFLTETEPLIARVEEISVDTAKELYSMYLNAVEAATLYIKEIDPELRVSLCGRLDVILERIVDLAPHCGLSSEIKKIYTPAVQGFREWSNTELMKDKGLAGHTLAKELSASHVMYFGAKSSDYSYLAALPETELIFEDRAKMSAKVYYDFLGEHFMEMDVLILHGMHSETTGYLDAYRKLRPDGKVYCGLDMNRYWMERIDWANPFIKKFGEQCDVIATSCRLLRDALNRNPEVSFPCRWLTNGFYDPAELKVAVDPGKKEDVILTVARIGAAEKNNSELLLAFARVSGALPEWSVRLVGAVNAEFIPFLDRYFEAWPELKDRVVLTGPIADKAELYSEYAKAKIFALTSKQEGGTPNVYAEALYHGCMFVTSDIDAADDITDFGELGESYRNDGGVEALAPLLVKMCKRAERQAFEAHIPKALRYAAKHYDWNRNAEKLAYMLFD